MEWGSWHCTGDRNQDHPHGQEMQKATWLSGEALQISVKRRDAKSKGEKERYMHLNTEFQRRARRDKKAFLSGQCKEIEENNRIGKNGDLFKKIRDTKETFHASSVQFSRSVMSDSLRPHESQHTSPPCPSPIPGVHSDSCPSSQWCHPAISSSVVPFSSCP